MRFNLLPAKLFAYFADKRKIILSYQTNFTMLLYKNAIDKLKDVC